MLTRREALIRAAVAGAGALVRGASVLAAAPQQTFRAASQPATPVNFAVPTSACDCHLHIIDPRRFPFAESEGRESASVEESRALHRALHIDRVVLIQSGSYGADNSCLLDALRRLGSRARGVVVVTDKTSDAQLDAWDRAGVRGTRLSGGEGISASPDDRRRLQAAVQRLAGRRWHVNTAVQFQALEGLQDLLLASPVPVVIDHFAAAPASRGVRQPGFDVLLNLVRSGRIYLKLSREHNISTQAPDYPDVAPLATALVAANPRRILWATDWPHVNGPGGVDDGRIFNQFAVWVPDPVQRKTVLVDNPARLYGF